jgi:hypothetical protein
VATGRMRLYDHGEGGARGRRGSRRPWLGPLPRGGQCDEESTRGRCRSCVHDGGGAAGGGREHTRMVPLLRARRWRGRWWRSVAEDGNTPVEIGIGGRWDRPRLYGHGEESRWVLAPYSHMNGVWRVDLGAHPKLGALVGTLLELRFLSEHSYLVMGAQVGGVYWSCSNGPLQLHERRHIFFGNPKFEWRRVPLLLVYWVRPW